MNKKTFLKISLSALMVAFSLNVQISHAETASTTKKTPLTKMEQRMNELEAKKQKAVDIMKEKADKIKTEREKIQQERLSKIDKVSNQYTKLLTVLQKEIRLIQTRMLKIEAKGGTTATAKTLIKEAQDLIEKAKVEIASLSSRDTANATSTIKDTRAKISAKRAEEKQIREDIRVAHKKVSEAVASLKGAIAEKQNGNATSTATTTQTNN